MAITGNIVLALQALDANNQVLFNRNVIGLQNTIVSKAVAGEMTVSDSSFSALIPNNGEDLIGLYVKNNVPSPGTEVINVTWKYLNPMGGVSEIAVGLIPGTALMIFSTSDAIITGVEVKSNNVGDFLIEFAWWA